MILGWGESLATRRSAAGEAIVEGGGIAHRLLERPGGFSTARQR
jgi:hypothetical protein